MLPTSQVVRESSENQSTHGIKARFTTHYCRKTSRIFKPPSSSHFGGVWECCICTAQKILQALLQMQAIDDESLSTLMCEGESIMNGWPLTTVSTDQRDLEALTPFSRHRWKQVQYLSNIFWRQWSKEYLPQLQIRQKWLRKCRNLTDRDIVLVSTEHSPRNTWLFVQAVVFQC